MTRLDRYILGRFISALLLFMLFLLSLFVVIELFELREQIRIDAASLADLGEFLMLRAPFLAYISLPVALVLSTIFVIASRAQLSEIIAAQAAGISLLRYTAPILVGAGVLGLILLAGAEFRIPEWADRADTIRRVVIQRKLPPRIEYHDLAFVHDSDYVLADRFDPSVPSMDSVALITLTLDHARIADVRTFERLSFHADQWQTRGGIIVPLPAPRFIEILAQQGGFSLLADKPIEALSISTLFREMQDISGLVRKNPNDLRLTGELMERWVRIQAKIALPCSVPLLALIGICLGARIGRRQGMSAAIGAAFACSLGFMLLMETCSDMGHFAARNVTFQPIAYWFPWLAPLILIALAIPLVSRSRFIN